MRMTTIFLSVLALAGAASAQLVPPPTEAPPATEPVTLPPETAPVNIAPGPGTQAAVPPPAPAPEVFPPYDSLVKRDDKGKLVRIDDLADVAALKANPLVTSEQRDQANAYLAERRLAFEKIIIENLDIVDDLAGKKLDEMNVAERGEGLKWLIEALKPFTAPAAPGKIAIELNKRGVIDAKAMRLNEQISKEYINALRKEITEELAGGPEGKGKNLLAGLSKLIRAEALPEPLGIRRSLFTEAGKNLGSNLAKLSLSGETLSKANAIAKTLTPASSDDARVAAVDSLKDILSLDQRKELLRQAVAQRPKAK